MAAETARTTDVTAAARPSSDWPRTRWLAWWSTVAVVAVVFLLLAAASARYRLPVTDEAYLLLGIDRFLDGEVPIRDYQAYDPGRYWLLAPFRAVGGIAGTFLAGYALVLVTAIAVALTTRRMGPWWVSCGVLLPVLLTWCIPVYKPTDHMATHLLLAGTVLVCRRPTPRRWAAAGVLLGVVALLGRNFGLYGVLAFLGAVAVLHERGTARRSLKRLGLLTGGALLGWSPLWVRLVVDAELRDRYVRQLVAEVTGPTNIGVPVPWPWTDAGTADVLARLAFVVVPAALVVALVVGVRHRFDPAPWAPVALGAALVGLPVLHHAFARAVVFHLALAVGPAVAGALAVTTAYGRRTASPVLHRGALAACVTTFVVLSLTAVPNWPGADVAIGAVPVAPVEVEGEVRLLASRAVEYVQAVEELDELIAPDETFFVAPRDIGLYLYLDQRPPAHDTYFSLPRPDARRTAELIHDVASVDWYLLRPGPYAQNPTTDFTLSHPQVHASLLERCRRVDRVGPFEVHRCRDTTT